MSNHMPSQMQDEITYPFPNFNGVTAEGLEWINNYIPLFIMDVITYPWQCIVDSANNTRYAPALWLWGGLGDHVNQIKLILILSHIKQIHFMCKIG